MKLYMITNPQYTIFAEQDNVSPEEVLKRGKSYLRDEIDINRYIHDNRLVVEEITSAEQIPKDWLGGIYWGDNPNEYSPRQFLLNKDLDNQKQERQKFLEAKEAYLKLKDKFEPHE